MQPQGEPLAAITVLASLIMCISIKNNKLKIMLNLFWLLMGRI
jgi:hypothetical protein